MEARQAVKHFVEFGKLVTQARSGQMRDSEMM